MKIRLRSLSLASTVALLSSVAVAHHAYDANYTRDIGSIEGVVVDVFWANPHAQYYLEVTGDDGTSKVWIVEADNLSVMGRDGWTSTAVKRKTLSIMWCHLNLLVKNFITALRQQEHQT